MNLKLKFEIFKAWIKIDNLKEIWNDKLLLGMLIVISILIIFIFTVLMLEPVFASFLLIWLVYVIYLIVKNKDKLKD
jgi:hypothetical protein